jgi:D-glycero-alpha-D-manno-heptose 1-phosphate guanylyltransferase
MPISSNNNTLSMTAVILAGGRGTRIQHLLPGLPKPMAPVAGRPFLEWLLFFLRKQGITKAVISTGYLAEVIESYFKTHPVKGMTLSFCRETSTLGTAGGFLNAALDKVELPANKAESTDLWLVLNGDSLVLSDLNILLQDLDDPRISGSLIGLDMIDASRYGTLAYKNGGHLTEFLEKTPGSGTVNAGMYCFKHSVLSEFPQKSPLSFEKDVFPRLIDNGRTLLVKPITAPFLDIGTPESLPKVQEFILSHQEWF